MTEKKMDWHLFWTAASTVVVLGTIIIGCYVSLKTELNDLRNDISTIKTVMILKGIMPAELAHHKKD